MITKTELDHDARIVLRAFQRHLDRNAVAHILSEMQNLQGSEYVKALSRRCLEVFNEPPRT